MTADQNKSKKELLAELETARQEIAGLKEVDAERKRAEEASRESEDKYRTLFETMALGVVYQDAQGQILSANPAAERILGLSLDQMQGRTSIDPRWKSIHEDGSDFPGETHPAIVALQTGKKVLGAVMGVFNPNTEEHHWIKIDAIPQFRAGEDTPFKVYATFDDVTERKRAEETLREALNEFEVIFENSAMGIILIKENRRIHRINSRCTEILGYTPEEAIGGSARMFYVSDESFKAAGELHYPALAAGKMAHGEIMLRHKDGTAVWCDLYGKALSPPDLEKGSLWVLTDITERKKAEEALRETLAEFEAIFENSAVGIALLKGDRSILRINNRCSEIFGYTSDEAVGNNARMLYTSDQSFRETGERLYPALATGETAHAVLPLRRKDGATVWCDTYGKALFPPNLEKGSIWVFVDITERRKLNMLQEDVDRILRHDLRTPLSGIIGLPKVMLDDENLTPEQTGYLKLIQDAGYRMLNQINLSLDLYKMETDAFQYDPKPVESAGLLKRLLHDLGLKAGGKGVGLEVLVEGTPWDKANAIQFQADEALCYTMLANLLDNAVDASPLGARVTLHMEEEPDAVAFSVHNIGEVPEPVRDNFFDKYATHGKFGGTGLGTYSAKLMAEAQGGSICMESSRQKGTTVTIRLPKN